MNSHDEYIVEFDLRYVEDKRIREQEIGRKPNSSEIAAIRSAIRNELRTKYPDAVAVVEHYNIKNLEYSRKTGRPFPSNAEMAGDAKWIAGASIEQRLRALTTSRIQKRRRRGSVNKEPGISQKHTEYKETLQYRLGNVRARYYNMVKKYGYLPSDALVEHLSGVTLRMAGELRTALLEEFDLTEYAHGENVPEAFRPYWIATLKEDSTVKLVNVIQGLGEDDRKALIELLASIRNGS